MGVIFVPRAVVILTIDSLQIRRGELLLCAGINACIKSGDIYHVVGVNGAGKSTFLMQLARLLPSVGIDWHGHRLVYVGYALGLTETLTVTQNLQFLLGLYGVALTTEALNQALVVVGLSGYEGALVGQLSSGQQRRASLARLWLIPVHIAPIWLLDEPLTALDTWMVGVLEQKIVTFARDGGAVVLTSHQRLAIATDCIDLGDYRAEEGDDD